MEALHDVVKAGKARYLGASSMWAWQFAKMQYTAQLHGWTRFVSMQDHYNLLKREEEREMIPFCLDAGHRPDPVEPAGPRLPRRQPSADRTGETTVRAETDDFAHRLYYEDADFAVVDRVVELATKARRAPAQVALAWLLAQPAVDRADRRREQDVSTGGSRRSAEDRPHCRRARLPASALRPAPDIGSFVAGASIIGKQRKDTETQSPFCAPLHLGV